MKVYRSEAQKRKLAADRKKNAIESHSSNSKLANYFFISRQLVIHTNSFVSKDLVANVVDTTNNHFKFVEIQQNQLSEKTNDAKNKRVNDSIV